jgi:hypothetical protein
MVTGYHYYITTEQRVIPPVGGMYNFVARIAYFARTENGVRQTITAPLSEEWGETEEDVRQKLEARIEQWIAAQRGERGAALRRP